MTDAIVALAAWITVVIQLVVLPFFGKVAELFKEYEQSGELALVRARLEEHGVLPPLAALFDKAVEAQEDRRRKIMVRDLLQRVDLFPDVERVVQAASEISRLNNLYGDLRTVAPRVATTGLAHCGATILLVPSCWFILNWTSQTGWWRWPIVGMSAALWGGTFVATTRRYLQYRGIQGHFIACLSKGREVGSDR
ncbi:MAG: hypothetical protein WDO69_33435 [Pseudomonadota bacterium]